MSGACAYNKLIRNFRGYYRTCDGAEISMDLKRRFSVSSKLNFQENKTFSMKSLLEQKYRKMLWEEIKFEFNEKLVVMGEILTRQCNFIASHRARRMSQVWNLYHSLYSKKTFQDIFAQFARNLRSKRRPLSVLLGTSLFSWEKEKITDEEIQNCVNELNRYRSHTDHPTKPITGEGLVNKLLEDGWEAVIQKECVQVWRKSFPDSYLYEYKIMGTFYDVPARTFFAVQTDIEYRKKWDKLVIKLDVIDQENNDNGCEVMHWVMHYPYPMYSREYVYIRRAVVSPKTNTMVLVSRSIDHPSCPKNNKYVRVTKYSSRMVIRPHQTYDENGFDYVLTYFDDPQAAFPAPAYNWMASSGVPDFVEKLHNAARELHKERKCKTSLLNSKLSDEHYSNNNNMEYIYM